MAFLEVCVFSASDAMKVAGLGADRLEICHDYAVGGVSLTLDELQGMAESLVSAGFVNEEGKIRGIVMVRPRSGDFVYTTAEKRWMLNFVDLVGEMGFQGVVLGCLTPENQLDSEFLAELAVAVQPFKMELVFHRAFDDLLSVAVGDINGIKKDIDQLSTLGVNRILTGMGASSMEMLMEIKECGDVMGVSILPGGGIRTGNMLAYFSRGFEWVHSACGEKSANGFELSETILKEMMSIAREN